MSVLDTLSAPCFSALFAAAFTCERDFHFAGRKTIAQIPTDGGLKPRNRVKAVCGAFRAPLRTLYTVATKTGIRVCNSLAQGPHESRRTTAKARACLLRIGKSPCALRSAALFSLLFFFSLAVTATAPTMLLCNPWFLWGVSCLSRSSFSSLF